MTDRKLTISNVLSVIRILLTPVFLYLIFQDSLYQKHMAVIVFGIASMTDFLDGRLARWAGTVTVLGRFLDPLADKILVSSALIAFVVLGMVEAWLVGVLLVRDLTITGLRMFAIRQGSPLVTSRLAKWKTCLQLVLIIGILVYIDVRVIEAEMTAQPLVLVDPVSHLVLNGLVAAVTLLAVVSGAMYLVDRSRSGR